MYRNDSKMTRTPTMPYGLLSRRYRQASQAKKPRNRTVPSQPLQTISR